MKTIPIKNIVVGDRLRQINEFHARELSESILEEGLLQPIVLRMDNRLINGGHRLAAFTILATNTDLPEEKRREFSEIPYIYFEEYLRQTGRIAEDETISDGKLRLLEMEENLKRLEMTWQEKCMGVYEYHREQVKTGRKLNVRWMQETTGAMLNLSQASVSQNIKIGEELVKNKQSPLAQCGSLAEALRFRVGQKLDEAARIRSKRIREKTELARQSVPKLPAEEPQLTAGGEILVVEAEETTSEQEFYSQEMIESLYYRGDFREQLPLIAKAGRIDHIICDPPYAIDMANLDTFDSINRIEETHQVEPNKELLVDLLDLGYHVIAENGFMCLWYDLDMHEMLQREAKKIGWRVCRWPLVWCKTSPCRNSSAQYNITKSTEVCMFLRRSERSVLATKQPNNYVLADAVSSKTHPFVKPFKIWERIINAVSFENQTIVDPFAGEGSCLEAALKLNRYAFGCEVDEAHINMGVIRLHEKLNSTATAASMFTVDTPF